MKNFAFGTWIPGEVRQGEQKYLLETNHYGIIYLYSILQMLVDCLLNLFAGGELLHVPTRPKIGALPSVQFKK